MNNNPLLNFKNNTDKNVVNQTENKNNNIEIEKTDINEINIDELLNEHDNPNTPNHDNQKTSDVSHDEQNKENDKSEKEVKSEKKEKKVSYTIAQESKRKLPDVLNEVMNELGVEIVLKTKSYALKDFYGMEEMELFESEQDFNVLIAKDMRGKTFIIKKLEDLVALNIHVWNQFNHEEKYKKIDSKWLMPAIQFDLIEFKKRK